MAEQDFGWALAQMRAGHNVRRKGWDVSEWIALRAGKLVNDDGTPCRFTSNDPLLAFDWVLA